MLWIPKRRFIRRVAFTTFKVFTIIFTAIFVIFPLIFKYSYKLQSAVVFLNFRYGDSSNVDPSEPNIVKDCMFVYKWVANRTKANIFIWGHSLGTSLATQSVVHLQNEGYKPTGLILEAPFNNMREEISEFPMSRMFKYLPWFTYTVVDPMQANGFTFQTDQFICNVNAPIIILHAEDDHVVPYKLGYKLYQKALKCRQDTQGKLLFIKFDEKHNYDHKFICRAPELHDIISDFVCEAITECREKKLLTA